ncbi:MAG: amino acid adenylation domain-containing protein, partial [bacterium]|nr:amino acid adenylation domain-containing protein [bacterium]
MAGKKLDKANIEDVYPMSDIQLGMVYYTLKSPTASLYHIQNIFQQEDKHFQPGTFKKAMELVVQKHPILRTGFNMYGFKKPVQIVFKKITPDIQHIDISTKSKNEKENYIKHLLAEDREKPFNITEPEVPWRLKTLDLGDGNIAMLWLCHHAITDGWSTASMVTELNNTYLKLKTDPGFVPQKLKNSYKAFIIQQELEKKNEATINYWKKELAGYKRFAFPSATRNELQLHQRKQYTCVLPPRLHEKLTAEATKLNTSFKNICFAAYLYALSMFSYDNDIVVGNLTHNRPVCEEGTQILGCFLNTLPVRLKIPGKTTCSDYIRLVENKLLEFVQYGRLPLLEIVKGIGEETTEQNPIFDTLFNYVDFHVYRDVEPQQDETERPRDDGILDVKGQSRDNTLFNFDISSTAGNFSMFISYTDAVISDEHVMALSNYFKGILEKFANAPGTSLEKDDILTVEEKRKLLFELNDTGSHYYENKRIHDMFCEQAARTPAYTAMIGMSLQSPQSAPLEEKVYLTYLELEKRMNRLARKLKEKGVDSDTVVGIMVNPCQEMIAGLLGILKAGGAYLPLLPSLPPQRISYMLEDSRAGVLLTSNLFRDLVEETTFEKEILYLEDILPETAFESQQSAPPTSMDIQAQSSLAYIIYTSGTTGKPKGVMVEHRNVAAYFYSFFREFEIKAGDTVIQLVPYAFDAFVEEVFPVLLRGGNVFIPGGSEVMDIELLTRMITKYNVNIIDCTPMLLNEFNKFAMETAETGGPLKSVHTYISGGDVLKKEYVDKLAKTGAVYNTYGPTESTVCASYYRYAGDDSAKHISSTLPIGSPIANYKIYILDKNHCCLPVGVGGEICITGPGVVRGYMNRPELTAEKFIPNPYLKKQNQGPVKESELPEINTLYSTLYKTGDLARWQPGGNIEFLGRIDRQVKIRGYRIETEEIEARLLMHPEIKEAVVVAGDGKDGSKYLVAYCVPQTDAGENSGLAADLKESLSADLPQYMIPPYFMFLDQMPLNANGKLDKKKLPSLDINPAEDYVAPKSTGEKKLVGIWAEILGIKKESIGINANFFQLGGHSLSAITLIARIHKEFDVKLTLPELFDSPTIQLLLSQIERATENKFASIEPAEKKEYYPFTSAQKRMFIVDEARQDMGYNMPVSMLLKGDIQKEKVEWVFNRLIQRHEIFRTTFNIIGDNLVQRVHRNEDNPFKVEYFEGDEGQAKIISGRFFKRFDLSKLPLLKVGLIKIDEKKYVFLMDMHHIIMDHISERILIEEFTLLYSGEIMPEMKIQYKDYSEWQNSATRKETIKKQKAYWLKELGGELPQLNLPLDYARPLVQDYSAHNLSVTLEKEQTNAVRALVRKENSTVFMVLLGIFNIALAKITGQSDIMVGTAISGRTHEDLARTIGMFANTLVLRNFPEDQKTNSGFLAHVKERTLQAFENQLFEFDELVESLNLDRQVSRNPLVDVMFALQTNDKQKELQVKLEELRKESGIPFLELQELQVLLEEIRAGKVYSKHLGLMNQVQ